MSNTHEEWEVSMQIRKHWKAIIQHHFMACHSYTVITFIPVFFTNTCQGV